MHFLKEKNLFSQRSTNL